MKFSLPYLFILFLLITSCGGSKSVSKNEKLKTETLKAIVKNYDKSSPKFQTMRGRLKGVFVDGEDQQGINISYRYKKDEVLWMSAKLAGLIQVAKVMISPNRIQFYERIDQSYFDGDFKLVSSFLGIELNYNQLQNLLLGQAIKPIDIEESVLESLEGFFQIRTNFERNLSQSLLLDDKTFKLKQQTLKMNDKQINVIYKSYQVIDGMLFPEEMVITAGDSEDQVSIILDYKNISLNDDLNFPFSFPNNFKPLELN
jgi:hypothetical protein